MVAAKEEPAAPEALAIHGILAEITMLNKALQEIDLKIAKVETIQNIKANLWGPMLEKFEQRIARLESRHTGHLHWTNRGR
jgi:hypothetical protein